MTEEKSLTALFANGLRGLIFDCDGVLVDSREANIGYYNMLLRELGKPPLTQEQEDYAQMATAVQAVQQVLTPEEMLQVPAVCQRYPYREVTLPLLRLEPGLRDMLEWLHEMDVRLAVHTNRGAGVYDVLRIFDMGDFFNPIINVDVAKPKPDPEGVFEVLRRWKLPATEVAFVGDSSTDAGAAAGAGVPLVAFRNRSLPAAWHVDSFAAFHTALQGVVRVECVNKAPYV